MKFLVYYRKGKSGRSRVVRVLSVGDWVEYVHKLSKLYWDTADKRMEQTTQTIASVVPFARSGETPAGEKRKAA